MLEAVTSVKTDARDQLWHSDKAVVKSSLGRRKIASLKASVNRDQNVLSLQFNLSSGNTVLYWIRVALFSKRLCHVNDSMQSAGQRFKL